MDRVRTALRQRKQIILLLFYSILLTCFLGAYLLSIADDGDTSPTTEIKLLRNVSILPTEKPKVSFRIEKNDAQLFQSPYQPTNFLKNSEKLRCFVKYIQKYHEIKDQIDVQSEMILRNFIYVMETHLFSYIKKSFVHSVLDMATTYYGKGIVLSAYNQYFPYAYGTILMIRTSYASNLPIEVFYAGDNDLSKDKQKMLEEIPNVRCRNIYDYIDETQQPHLAGFAIKVFALLASSFDETILIDADAVFLQDPIKLFDFPEYHQTDTIFFRDRMMYDCNRQIEWIRSIIGPNMNDDIINFDFMTKKASHQQESGVVVIKKSTKYLGMLAVVWLNSEMERTVTYQKVYGDKETFWIGFGVVNETFRFVNTSVGEAGVEVEPNNVHGFQSLHLDWKNEPFWLNDALVKYKGSTNIAQVTELQCYQIEPGKWVRRALDESFTLHGQNQTLSFSNSIRKVIDDGLYITETIVIPMLRNQKQSK